jgi:hypothetical protein
MGRRRVEISRAGETMLSAEQVLLGLAIFFFLLWAPLVVGFLISKMRDHREPRRDEGRT